VRQDPGGDPLVDGRGAQAQELCHLAHGEKALDPARKLWQQIGSKISRKPCDALRRLEIDRAFEFPSASASLAVPFFGGACIAGAFVLSSASMKKRMTNRKQSRTRVTVSLPSDLVRRLDGQSRAQGASRSGVAERWLRAGERQASLFSLEQELERYYAQPIEPEETGLSAALGKAARETAAEGDRGRRPRGRSR